MADGAIEANFYYVLGSQIEIQRKRAGLTQTDLGALLGVHRNTILRWESGECPVDAWQLLRMADVLHCNHLLLLPAKEFTWGGDLIRMEVERNRALKKPVQSERDPIGRFTKGAA